MRNGEPTEEDFRWMRNHMDKIGEEIDCPRCNGSGKVLPEGYEPPEPEPVQEKAKVVRLRRPK